MNRLALERFKAVLVFGVAGLLVALALWGCAALKRSAIVATATAVGGGVGLVVAGPPGAVGLASLAGGTAHALVEADDSGKRADSYAAVGRPYVPQPPAHAPSLIGIAWWWWTLAALYVVWRNRAHLFDFLFVKGKRVDAVLRAVGWRTHRS